MLALAPTPEQGRECCGADIAAGLRRAGRQRNVQAQAKTIHQQLRAPQRTAPPLLSKAYGATTAAAVAGAHRAQLPDQPAGDRAG